MWGWYNRQIKKEKDNSALSGKGDTQAGKKWIKSLVEAKPRKRAVPLHLLYERHYTGAPVNVLVYRREIRKIDEAWQGIYRAQVARGAWEEDPNAEFLSIPETDEDVTAFQQDPDDEIFLSDLALFDDVRLGDGTDIPLRNWKNRSIFEWQVSKHTLLVFRSG